MAKGVKRLKLSVKKGTGSNAFSTGPDTSYCEFTVQLPWIPQ